MTHDWVSDVVRRRQYVVSHHADQERMNDNLSIAEIETSIINGRLLESYPDTGRGESVLIVGFTDAGRPIHTVIGRRGSEGVIITVYIPGPPKFADPFHRSK